MDILNFISWIKNSKLVSSIDTKKTLVPLGVKNDRRDDSYTPVTMTVEDLGSAVDGFQEYTVLLVQRGVNDPVATVLKNTLDVNVTFFYAGLGAYAATFDKPVFNSPNEYVTISSGMIDPISGNLITIEAVPVFTVSLFIQSFLGGTPSDNVIGADFAGGFPCVLTIRKYN